MTLSMVRHGVLPGSGCSNAGYVATSLFREMMVTVHDMSVADCSTGGSLRDAAEASQPSASVAAV